MKRLFKELGLKQSKFVLYSDSHSTIRVDKNPSFCAQSKHIKVRYGVRNVLDEKQLVLEDDNGSNIRTKSLLKSKHDTCCTKIDMGLVLIDCW